jgi:hypothetical protein
MTIQSVCVILLSAGLTWAQTTPLNESSSTSDPRELAGELESLRKALAKTQKQVAAQQREIEALKNGARSVDELAAFMADSQVP